MKLLVLHFERLVDIVLLAIGYKDLSTLAVAFKATDLVESLQGSGLLNLYRHWFASRAE